MRVKKALGNSLLAGMTLAGILAGTAGTASASTGKTVTIWYNLNDKKPLDPALWSQEMYLDSEGIFEGLVTVNAKGQDVPGSATSWSHNKDNTVWTFHLRNMKFSNGDKVTAGDFVYEADRVVNANTAATAQAGAVPVGQSIPITNIQQIRAGTADMSTLGMKAVNDSTLQITLSHSDPNLIRDLTLPVNLWIVPTDPSVVNNLKPSDWDNPADVVGNGPYEVASYKIGTSLTLVPNPHYYTKVNLHQVNFYYTTADGLVPFGSGQVDVVPLQAQDIKAADSNPTLKSEIHWQASTGQWTLEIANSQNPILRNSLDVREAFAMAINKDAIVNNVLKGAALPAYEYFLPVWQDPWIKSAAPGYNPKEAQQLMAKAGFPGGKGFPTVELYTATQPNDPVSEAIQQMWESTLGVNVQLVDDQYSKFIQDLISQLPSNEVGFYNWGTSGTFPSYMLPQSVDQWLGPNQSAIRGFASPSGYAKYTKDTNITDPVTRLADQDADIWNTVPTMVKQWLYTGIRAYKTGSQSEMEKYYELRSQDVLDIPVYTARTPMLIRNTVHGYVMDPFIGTLPPTWINDITVS